MNATVAPQSGALSKNELVDVVEGWLRSDPDLKFKSAKKDAQKFLGVAITPRLFRAACDRLSLARPFRSVNKGVSKVARESTPLMLWLVDYLTRNPEATFHDAKDAARKAGHPFDRAIVFGLARKRCGLAPMTKRARKPGAAKAGKTSTGRPVGRPKGSKNKDVLTFRANEISELPFRQIEARFRALQSEVERLRTALGRARAALESV